MGRTKNRKKRRLGRIHKQTVNVDPWIPYYDERSKVRLLTWCGFYKWYYAADTKSKESYDEIDDKELETKTVPSQEHEGYFELLFPNSTEYGSLRMLAKDLKACLEFDDSVFKSKHYHSRKVTRIRKREIEKYIKKVRKCVEISYKKVEDTEPERIEQWIKDLLEME